MNPVEAISVRCSANLELGKELVAKVRALVPDSPNCHERSLSLRGVEGERYQQLAKELLVREAALHAACARISGWPLEHTLQRAVLTEEAKVGNCREMTDVAMKCIVDQRLDCVAEEFWIGWGNHVFLVLDRDQNSNPRDHKTWGPDAAVVDTWGGIVFPASEVPTKLFNFETQIQDPKGPWRTMLKPLDPRQFFRVYSEPYLGPLKVWEPDREDPLKASAQQCSGSL